MVGVDDTNDALGSRREIALRVKMGVDQIEIASGSEPRQHATGKRLEAIAVDGHETGQRNALTRSQHELRLHGFEQIELPEALQERPRRLELSLIGLQKTEHALQILGALAVGIEQALAETAPIYAGVFLVKAKGEGRLVLSRKHKRIAAHESVNVFGVPSAVFIDVEVFSVANAEKRRGHHIRALTREHDRIFRGREVEFGSHQRHRIDALCEAVIAARLD